MYSTNATSTEPRETNRGEKPEAPKRISLVNDEIIASDIVFGPAGSGSHAPMRIPTEIPRSAKVPNSRVARSLFPLINSRELNEPLNDGWPPNIVPVWLQAIGRMLHMRSRMYVSARATEPEALFVGATSASSASMAARAAYPAGGTVDFTHSYTSIVAYSVIAPQRDNRSA